MPDTPDRLLALTTQIVAAYVGANTVEARAVPDLIRDIQRSLIDLQSDDAGSPAERRRSDPEWPHQPAVEIRKSVFANHLVCLEDGMRVMMLKRHLRTAHHLTPDQYRAKWGLPADYPMVAPNYAKVRSRLAKESGLGQKRRG
jgi:predicted transcriptional regulator